MKTLKTIAVIIGAIAFTLLTFAIINTIKLI